MGSHALIVPRGASSSTCGTGRFEGAAGGRRAPPDVAGPGGCMPPRGGPKPELPPGIRGGAGLKEGLWPIALGAGGGLIEAEIC